MAWVPPTGRQTGFGEFGERLRRTFDSLGKLLDRRAPIGSVHMWLGASTSVPDGSLLCYGQTVAIAEYPKLYAILGTTYGSGTGLFGIPDLRGRVLVGLDNMGGTDAGRLSVANTLGGTGGTQTHTLTVGEMPSHDHDFGAGTTAAANFAGSGGLQGTQTTAQATIANAGGGGAHNNMQPYLLANYIIIGK